MEKKIELQPLTFIIVCLGLVLFGGIYAAFAFYNEGMLSCPKGTLCAEGCFYDWDIASECGGYTNIVPITNGNGTFYHCEPKNWTIRAC
jgi:hypothetical protein